MLPFLDRVGSKLIVLTVALLCVFAAATAFAVLQGFQQTQAEATEQSIEALEAQGRTALLDIAQREAQLAADRLEQAAVQSRSAAAFVGSIRESLAVSSQSMSQIETAATGAAFDVRPERSTELYIPRSVSPTAASVQDDIQDTTSFDALFPTMLAQNPDSVAIYYIGSQGFLRYYPVVDLQSVLPADFEILDGTYYTVATPENNPTRETVWTEAYLDPAGQGLMVSVSTPVYEGDTFRGIMGVDVTLQQISEHLNRLRPTPNGFAFLIDQNGKLIAAPPTALELIVGQSSLTNELIERPLVEMLQTSMPEFNATLSAMANGGSSVTNAVVGDVPMFLAYAPLVNLGWNLAIVAPVGEVIAESAHVSDAIADGITAIVRSTLIVMGLTLVLAIAGTALFSRQLTEPIRALAQGTKSVSAGDFNVEVPITSHDELGLLAQSFNSMTQRIRNLLTDLEMRNQEAESARARAEQSDKTKSAFLASMSHELRTPLNAVINFSKYVAKGSQGPVNEKQAQTLGYVIENGNHLLALINDVLDMSKIEAGSLNLFIEDDIDVHPILEAAVTTGRGMAEGKPVRVSLDVPNDLPKIRADRQRVLQILLNIMSNACKFTDEGSVVVRAVQDEDQILLSIADTGPGIATADHEAVFTAFKQTESGLRQVGGTGLGMPISKSLTEAHGGRMWFESEVGLGTTFYVALPVNSEMLESSILA